MSSAPVMYDDTAGLSEPGPQRHPTPIDDPPSVPAENLGLIADVEALAFLRPGWDGEGSSGVDMAAIRRARRFVENLRVPWLPIVGANAIGGVRVEWDAGESYLIVDFEPGGAQVLFGVPGRGPSVWRNDEIPAFLDGCFLEVYRTRQGT
jgi:hypothetical protein